MRGFGRSRVSGLGKFKLRVSGHHTVNTEAFKLRLQAPDPV